jgi:hypothetical protein
MIEMFTDIFTAVFQGCEHLCSDKKRSSHRCHTPLKGGDGVKIYVSGGLRSSRRSSR